jgi:transposase
MRPPAQLKPWLSPEQLAIWVREASTREAYQKRLAIWLTFLRRWAPEIADLLQLSKQAVWLWVGQYNRYGPEGLTRKGRGGRSWSYLSWAREEELLQSGEKRALRGEILSAPQLLPEAERAVGKKVSLDYVYKLLHRYRWRKLWPRPRHVKADQAAQAEFKKIPCPCPRTRSSSGLGNEGQSAVPG